MKILHLIHGNPDVSTQRVIEQQAKEHQVKVVDLSKQDVSYEALVEEIFAHEKVISW